MSKHTIEVRNLRFPIDSSIPKHWHGGKRAVSIFFDNLSLLFPQGEKFFMASVKNYEGQVKDPALKKEMRAFYAQEMLHSREHLRYNDMLEARGYPITELDRSLEKLLSVVYRLPNRLKLAVTCSLEHFTALLAQVALKDDSTLGPAHPVMKALWRWHAAEENEHATVAYDVFKNIGGTYIERVVVMFIATLIFWARVGQQQVAMMRADGTLNSMSEWRSLWKFCMSDPGWIRALVVPYLSYYRPGFHPSELDCAHLLDQWREDFKTHALYVDSLQGNARHVAA